MKAWMKYAAAGLLYSLTALLLSRCLITSLGAIFGWVSSIIGVAEDLKDFLVPVLSQLKGAQLGSPWLLLLLGTAAGALYGYLIRRCRRRRLLSGILAVVLFLPLLLVNIGFTQVNGLRPVSFLIKPWTDAPMQVQTLQDAGDTWYFGFGSREILPDENSDEPLYIAGYNNGVEITDVLDYCQARALWLDAGGEGLLVIGIDCVALDSGAVQQIRDRLADIPGCAAIHVYSTHTHAGIDTLGLWGPTMVDGKNDAYMEALFMAAEDAARDAAANRKAGSLFFGQRETVEMYRDSRDPQVFDANLYQLRFEAADGSAGLRLFFYGAHAESLRGSNTLLSRDFPGILCDDVAEATGDDTMFFPGAIGGLIMTREFIPADIRAERNLTLTAQKLVDYALSITEDEERLLAPNWKLGRTQFVVPMDNTGFWLYKFLGILHNHPVPANSATGYGVETELSVVMLDELALTFIPGEIFPELVLGGEYGDAAKENENPEPLKVIAGKCGVDELLIIGLANDEIGYIVPPSDFLLNEKLPYLEKTMDYKGENHYEETNSIGPECAPVIAEAFKAAIQSINP